MIELLNIGVKREGWVLKNISLNIIQGELIGVIGKSGAGKTTLLKLIAGLIDTDEGEVRFEGDKLFGPSVKLIPGYEDLHLVNQDFELELFHTVIENVKEKVLHLPQLDRDALVNDLLVLMELDGIKSRQAKLLSGGEKQRLAIARALACEPKVLLLDEPFVHLDQRLRLNITQYLLKLSEIRKMTIVLVSHDGSEMMGFVKKIIHLDDRGVKRIASAQEMYYLPEDFNQGELMGLINELNVNGEKFLFRPNEYELNADQMINVQFLDSFEMGLLVFNTFKTLNNEYIVLTSIDSMIGVKQFKISKRG